MKEKLQLLMDRLQLRPGQFARMLDINPAMISHILAERNKPGVDLLQKILARFPQVSPDWLLLDSGEMFRDGYALATAVDPVQSDKGTEETLFDNDPETLVSTVASASSVAFQTNGSARQAQMPESMPAAISSRISRGDKQITHIVLFYADGTFEDFLPSQNL